MIKAQTSQLFIIMFKYMSES